MMYCVTARVSRPASARLSAANLKYPSTWFMRSARPGRASTFRSDHSYDDDVVSQIIGTVLSFPRTRVRREEYDAQKCDLAFWKARTHCNTRRHDFICCHIVGHELLGARNR